KSTFERRDGIKASDAVPTAFWRDHVIAWYKDVGRSVDYLETRPEIDHSRIAYFGFSWGAEEATRILAIQDRFKAAVVVAGGLFPVRLLPEVEAINFIGRVHLPVLMLNGRYDAYYAEKSSQRPMFDLLGTAPDRKRLIVFESGHMPPRKDVIRESLTWLDTYLGPVER